MEDLGFNIIEIEKHDTTDIISKNINGELTVIWRDWDNIIKDHPKMVYMNTVNPGEIKGPHLHKNRTTYFSCVQGEIIIIFRKNDGEIHELKSNTKNPSLICIKNGIAAAIINPTKEIAKVLVLADIAWKPNDNEMENLEFLDYNFKKWV